MHDSLKRSTRLWGAGLAWIVLATCSAPCYAARLTILSAGAPRHALQHLAGAFQRQIGLKLDFSFASAGIIQARLAAGAKPDVIILPRHKIEDLQQQGRLVAGTISDLGQVPVGVAVPAGAPVPDLSSAAAFRQALRQADTVAYGDPARASTGKYFKRVVGQLGLDQAMAAHGKVFADGYGVLDYLADHARPGVIGITQKSEILSYAARGIRYVGAFPAPLSHATTYTAAVSAGSAHRHRAAAFVHYLKTPAARRAMQAAGFD